MKRVSIPRSKTRNLRSSFVRLALIALCLGLAIQSHGDDERQLPPDVTILDQAWRFVANDFYDPKFKAVKNQWGTLHRKYRAIALKAKSQEEVHSIILDMLSELKASHLTLVESDVFKEHILAELKNKPAITFGADLAHRPEGLFFVSLADEGPCLKAGIRRGDRLLSINGQDALNSPYLRPAGSDPGFAGPVGYHLSPKKGMLELYLERRSGIGEKGFMTLKVKPFAWNLVAASKSSIRVIEQHGVKMGYMHLWHLAHTTIVDSLHRALRNDFRDCHGLLLDLRGRGGTPANVDETLALFDEFSPFGPRWTRPVVAIIDGGTRSAKEVLAFHLKRRGIATLVGEQTQGAVLGAKFFPLRDGSQLMLPTTDMRALTMGISLEMNGIKPHIKIEDKIPWANGQDPLFDKARKVLFWKLRKRFQKRHKRGWY